MAAYFWNIGSYGFIVHSKQCYYYYYCYNIIDLLDESTTQNFHLLGHFAALTEKFSLKSSKVLHNLVNHSICTAYIFISFGMYYLENIVAWFNPSVQTGSECSGNKQDRYSVNKLWNMFKPSKRCLFLFHLLSMNI